MSEIQAESVETPVEPVEASQGEQKQEQKTDTSWVPRRISEITAARRAAEARAAELEVEVQRLRAAQAAPAAEGQTAPVAAPASPQQFEQLVAARAEAIARQQREQETLNQGIARINETGAKEFGEDFEKSVQNLQMAGVGGPEFLKVLTNIDKPAAVVTWLGKTENLNEAMRLASLDPVQMGIEMAKLSGKASKDLSKQISKAPAPITPVDGSGGSGGDVEPDPKDTKAWMAWRAKNKKTRR